MCVAPLLQGTGIQLSMQVSSECIPRAGRFSVADWSSPGTPDKLGGLRKAFLSMCLSVRADKRLLARASNPIPEPLFSASEVERA